MMGMPPTMSSVIGILMSCKGLIALIAVSIAVD
jgi:hypothetical protein